MIDNIKAIASIVILPSILLYIIGFICVEAYYSQFGIISFDIVNSRFIIAGIHSAIAIGSCLIVSHYLYFKFLKGFITEDRFKIRKQRYQVFLAYFGFTIALSTALTQLFNVGRLSAESPSQPIVFSMPFGRYDIVGRIISVINLSYSNIFVIIGWSIYVFVYIFIVIICFILIYKLHTFLRYAFRKALNKPFIEPDSHVVINHPDNNSDQVRVSARQRFKIFTENIITLSGIFGRLVSHADSLFMISATIVTLFLSIHRELQAYFVFTSFEKNFKIGEFLVFSWVFNFLFSLCIFYNWFTPAKGRTLDLFGSLRHPLMISEILFQIVVPLIVAIYTFGATIFPRIPYSIGGGEPRMIFIKSTLSPDIFPDKKLYMIGESSQFVFVIDPEKGKFSAFQFNKNNIIFIKTR